MTATLPDILQAAWARKGDPIDPIAPTLQGYYPSVLALLHIRYDEAYLAPAAPPVPGKLGVGGLPVGGKPTLAPPVLSGAKAADGLSAVIPIVPKHLQIDANNPRQASRFNLTCDYRLLPIDPRSWRTVGVEIHLDTVAPEAYAAGVQATPAPTRARASMLTPTRANLRLAGFVDQGDTEMSKGKAEVVLQGRDLTGFLLDTPLAPDDLDGVRADQPVDAWVRAVLAVHPFYRGINVVVQPDDWPGGTVPTIVDLSGVTRVNRTAAGTAAQHPHAGSSHTVKLWDILTKNLSLVGAVPYFVGYDLHIRPMRSIYDTAKRAGIDPRVPTPFAGGRLRMVPYDQGGGRTGYTPVNIRQMVYGRNIRTLHMTRKLAGVTVPSVRLVTIDTSSAQRGTGKFLTVTWPLPPGVTMDQAIANARATHVAPDGSASASDVQTYPVHGVRDARRLLEMARNLYEEIGRGELGGTCETGMLASWGGDNRDPDLLRLQHGDPVQIWADASRGVVSERASHEQRSFEEEVQAVAQQIGDPVTARVLVTAQRGGAGALQNTFLVLNTHYTWDQGHGFKIIFDFTNYVEARSGVTPSQGPNTAAPVVASSPGVG